MEEGNFYANYNKKEVNFNNKNRNILKYLIDDSDYFIRQKIDLGIEGF